MTRSRPYGYGAGTPRFRLLAAAVLVALSVLPDFSQSEQVTKLILDPAKSVH